MNDPELDELFADPADRAVVDLLKASRPGAPPLDPHFHNYLRAKLMTEARRTLPARASRSWFPFKLSPNRLVPAVAAVAVGFVVVLGVEIYLHGQTGAPQVAYNIGRIDKQTNVGTGEPIVIPFTGPVDKTAVAESVVMQPATSVTKQWVGQNLVIIPDHPLAPNTTYSVSFKPLAVPTPTPKSNPVVRQSPTVAPTPVVVHFTTVRPPVAPIVPPSFKSASVNYGYDSRLADSGTILSAAWTPTGQVLVTRPVGQPGPGSSPSPSASTTPSGPPAPKPTTDVWLMSSLGTPIRILVPGGSWPAAAPSGGLIAAWQVASGNRVSLGVWDLQGNVQATLATLDGSPGRAPVWIGEDRIAYVDQGRLRIVDLHGAQAGGPALRIASGRLAASPISPRLAVEGADGSAILDLGANGAPIPLPTGATGFAWSSKGDLAFLVRRGTTTDLYVATDGQPFHKVATSPDGQTWSDLSWSPDSTSLLLATTATSGNGAAPSLVLINRDGSSPTPFGAAAKEYASPQWSPSGDLVLFTRGDEAGGRAFWTATATPSSTDTAANQALAEVAKFMVARINSDSVAAEAELDTAGLAAYQAGASSLLGPAGSHFSRYYPVTVQPSGSIPNAFLVGVRIFSAKNGVEISFFEEQLTLVRQGQSSPLVPQFHQYLVHSVNATPTMSLGRGPTVVSVEVVQAPPGEQVRVHFDADLKPETVSSGTIQVKDADGNVVDARVSFDADNHLATLAVKLKPGTYQLVVTTGVTDVNGVAVAQEYDAPLIVGR
ncbi:MAG TPA: Ig-like domain-containing protein [Candidatus Dormibacteraeota bacterium]